MTLKSLIAIAGCFLLTFTMVKAEDDAEKGPRRQRGERPSKEEMLKKYDKDGDGKLSEDERKALKEAVSARKDEMKKKKDEMMKKLDTDGDGTISEEEKKAAMQARLEERFKEVDTDGNGSLSFDEWKEGIKSRRGNRECPKCADNPGNGVCPHRGPKGRGQQGRGQGQNGPKGRGNGNAGGPEKK